MIASCAALATIAAELVEAAVLAAPISPAFMVPVIELAAMLLEFVLIPV